MLVTHKSKLEDKDYGIRNREKCKKVAYGLAVLHSSDRGFIYFYYFFRHKYVLIACFFFKKKIFGLFLHVIDFYFPVLIGVLDTVVLHRFLLSLK